MNTDITHAWTKLGRGEELTQEDVNAIIAEMPDIYESMRRTVESLTAWLLEVTPMWVSAITSLITQLSTEREALDYCPDQRVVQLAKYGKKARTRKKNLRRAYKIIEKEADE